MSIKQDVILHKRLELVCMVCYPSNSSQIRPIAFTWFQSKTICTAWLSHTAWCPRHHEMPLTWSQGDGDRRTGMVVGGNVQGGEVMNCGEITSAALQHIGPLRI